MLHSIVNKGEGQFEISYSEYMPSAENPNQDVMVVSKVETIFIGDLRTELDALTAKAADNYNQVFTLKELLNKIIETS